MKNFKTPLPLLGLGTCIALSATGGSSDVVTGNVPANSSRNQMIITLSTEDAKYYNTDQVSNVSVDGDAVTVTSDSFCDTFDGSVANISFKKGNKDAVNITAAGGWLESCYVEFALYDGATNYNVYVSEQDGSYIQLDSELVRNYGTYGRADAIGLAAGHYSMRVVPIANDGEIESATSEVTGIEVRAHDRSGFAFTGDQTPGAYNADGTLKPNTKVIYVTNDNFDTYTWTINKNAKGQTIDLVGVQAILNNSGYTKYREYNDTENICVRVIGAIDTDGFPSSAWGSSSEGLQVKGYKSNIAYPTTIEGVGNDGAFNGFGMLIRQMSHVEVRNLGFILFYDDGISIDTDDYYLWVHNNDIFYGRAGSDSDQAKGDGSVDSKGATNCTYSYNHFWDSGKCCLLENGTQPYSYADANRISYHHNWFDHSDSRHPRVRFDNVHVYNNYYDGISKYGVGSTRGSSVFVENNYYRNCKFPMLTSMQGNDLYAGTSASSNNNATFSKEDGGVIKSYGNIMTGSYSYIPYGASAYMMKGSMDSYSAINTTTHFDAYEAQSPSEQVPATVTSLQGSHYYSNFDTDTSIMYDYAADAAEDVPSVVTGRYGAGRLGHGDIQWTFSSADDTDYSVNTALMSLLTSYKSSFIGFFNQ